jgi:catechol 2,3-dioxygenase-like lactoylglutathione lyase family enzyme
MFIAKQLRDVRNGKMDRRQLIKGMALTATGAFVASAVPGAAPAIAQSVKSKGFKAICFNHISMSVADDVKARDFYVDLFGMECTWYTAEGGSEVDFGEQDALNEGEREAIFIRKFNPKVGHASIDHLSFSIDHFDLNAVKAGLESLGLAPAYDGPVMWTIKDPDGFVIQPGAKIGGYPGGIKPGDTPYEGYKNVGSMPHPLQPLVPFPEHSLKAIGAVVSIQVTDVAKTRNFYTSVLGMKVGAEKPGACFLRFGHHNGILLGKSQRGDNKAYVDHFTLIVTNKPEVVEAELKSRNLNPQKDPQAQAYTFVDHDNLTVKVAGTDILEGKQGLGA